MPMNRFRHLWPRIIRVSFLLLFILVPLVLTPWNYELFEYNKMMLTYGLVTVILGAWIIGMISQDRIRIRHTALDIPLLFFAGTQLVSTVFSIDRHVSWLGYYSRFNGGMLSILTYLSLYWAFVNLIPDTKATDDSPEGTTEARSWFMRLIHTILITASGVAIYGVLEHFGIDKHLWVQDVQNRVFSTLGQPNWLAAYLLAVIPLAFALFAAGKRRIIWGGVSVLFFLTLLWTRSRSGLMAFLTIDACFWGMLYLVMRKRMQGFLPGAIRSGLILHLMFVLIVAVNGTYIPSVDRWITVEGWKQRIQHMGKTQSPAAADPAPTKATASATLIESGVTDSGEIRTYVWQGALNAWRQNTKTFLIGTGTETFAFAFYQSKPVAHNLTSEWDFLYNKAHNEYLNFLATTGILGLTSYILLLLAMGIGFLRTILIRTDAARPVSQGKKKPATASDDSGMQLESHALHIGLFAGWLSVLITNFFGFSVVVTQLVLYLYPAFLMLSDLTGTGANADTHRDRYFLFSLRWSPLQRRLISAAIVVVTILFVASTGVTWFSDKEFASGYHLARSGYLPQAYQALDRAIRLNPREPVFHDEQGNVLATLALASWKEQQATVSQELATRSVLENNTALAASPNNVNFWKSRTKIFYALSEIDPAFLSEAISALEKARTLSPSDPKIFYNLAILYGQSGASDMSVSLMKEAIRLKPNYKEGYMGYAVLLRELGKNEEANAILNRYLETVDPNDGEIRDLVQ